MATRCANFLRNFFRWRCAFTSRRHHDRLEAANSAAEIKLRAERRAGELLAGMEKCKPWGEKNVGDIMSPTSLESIGVSKKQSSRWQKEANVDEDVFD